MSVKACWGLFAHEERLQTLLSRYKAVLLASSLFYRDFDVAFSVYSVLVCVPVFYAMPTRYQDSAPIFPFTFILISANLTREKIANSTARSIANCMEEVWDFMQKEMTKLQVKQVIAANCHCKEPPVYKVGDKVLLLTKNIRTERSLKKLIDKNIGPFKIKKLVGLLYQLELPYTIKIHDVFHLNLLQKAVNNLLPGQWNSPPPPTVVNNKEK